MSGLQGVARSELCGCGLKSQQRDQIDLDSPAFWQRGDLHCRSRRLVLAEAIRIDRVERLKIREVGEVDGCLEDLLEAAAGFLQHRREIVEDAIRLRGEVAFHELSGRGIERDLS